MYYHRDTIATGCLEFRSLISCQLTKVVPSETHLTRALYLTQIMEGRLNGGSLNPNSTDGSITY